jgi:hypothetical protein
MKKTTFYLIAFLAIMVSSLGALAQTPGGLTPLVNSTHSYIVMPGGANTLAWTVTPALGYTINSATNASTVNITWTVAGTYTLTFTETIVATGCKTQVQETIVVSPNTFNVFTTGPAPDCNVAESVIDPPTSYTNHVTIPVDMTTGNSWSPNWQFVFGLVGNNGTITNVKVDGVAQTGSSPYTITGINSTAGLKTVSVECDITGDPTLLQSVVLTINSAKELTYNTPSNATGTQSATQVINAIPATSAISAN